MGKTHRRPLVEIPNDLLPTVRATTRQEERACNLQRKELPGITCHSTGAARMRPGELFVGSGDQASIMRRASNMIGRCYEHKSSRHSRTEALPSEFKSVEDIWDSIASVQRPLRSVKIRNRNWIAARSISLES